MTVVDTVMEREVRGRLEEYSKYLGHNYSVDCRTFRLSGVSICPRKLYYFKKYPPKYNGKINRVFLIGQIFHELIQSVVFKDCKCEVEVRDTYRDINIIGHCDVLTDNSVVELKTCSILPKQPYTNHILQVNSYGVLLDREDVYVIYLQKNNLDVRAFRFKTDKSQYNKLCKTFYIVYTHLLNEQLPKKVESQECNYCGYKILCEREIL